MSTLNLELKELSFEEMDQVSGGFVFTGANPPSWNGGEPNEAAAGWATQGGFMTILALLGGSANPFNILIAAAWWASLNSNEGGAQGPGSESGGGYPAPF